MRLEGPLAALGRTWHEMMEANADAMAIALRRTALMMRLPDADERARADVEGARDWRDLSNGREWG